MHFFALQIQTGREKEFLTIAKKLLKEESDNFIWLRRTLRIRKGGKWKETTSSLFPGYIFLKRETVDREIYNKIKKIKGFIRFLKNNQDIQPLNRKDEEIILHFLKFGDNIERSLVTFDENQRIQVVSGPLKGIEGLIVKVNKRKGRAKVRLDIGDNAFLVDLPFEVINKPSEDSEIIK